MKNKKTWIGVVLLVVAAVLLAAVYQVAKPQPTAGGKTIGVEVIHGDGSTKKVDISTEEEYLGPALLASEALGVEGEQGAYGLYIKTVDGETASDAERTFWSLTKDGAEAPNGVDLTVIADGEHYELTLTKGNW